MDFFSSVIFRMNNVSGFDGNQTSVIAAAIDEDPMQKTISDIVCFY